LDGSTVLIKDVLDTRERDPKLTSRVRLRPGNWRREQNSLTDGQVLVAFDGDGGEVTLTTGFESRTYNQMEPTPVVERRANQSACEQNWRITTG
jgi:hypothetical protein